MANLSLKKNYYLKFRIHSNYLFIKRNYLDLFILARQRHAHLLLFQKLPLLSVIAQIPLELLPASAQVFVRVLIVHIDHNRVLQVPGRLLRAVRIILVGVDYLENFVVACREDAGTVLRVL